MEKIPLALRIGKSIPLPLRKRAFQGLAATCYYLISRHRLITLHNLHLAFPEKSMGEIRRLALGAYRNLGTVMAEFFDLPWITKENIGKWVEFEGLEHFHAARAQGKGVLASVGHFGNWELMAIAFAVAVEPIVIMYRPLDNAYLNRIVEYVRSRPGNLLFPKEGSLRKIIRLLKENKILGILNDQNVDTREGVFVDFFQRPACTGIGLAALALHTGAPILPVYMPRLPDGRYRFIFLPPFTAENTGDYNRDLLANTQRVTKILEDMIRQYPDQWLWLHQRWKTKKCQQESSDGNLEAG